MKKTFRILGISLLSIVGIAVVVAVVGAIVLWANSPGELDKLKDPNGVEIPGALSEKTFIEIGGMRQGFFLRGEDPQNPVILFLHGGPGSPELPFLIPYEKAGRLEKYFTVCYWDQRGAGMSFDGSITPADATLDHYIEDTRQITEYLRERFGQEKIYLMGHSWGSWLGVKCVQKHPELYSAYIGIGQVTDQLRSERLAWDYMLAHARETNDQKAVRQLEQFDPSAADFPSVDYLMGARTALMNKYHIGITHSDISMGDMAGAILSFGGYTFGEKIKYLRGMAFSSKEVFPIVTDDNLFVSARRFDIHVYIVHGGWDYQVSHNLAKEWFEAVEAPRKGFFTFADSAHSPNIEEPEKFVRIVRDIAQSSITQ